MAVLETTQFEQLVSEVKQQLLAESQGVGEVEVVDSLSGINSLPALRGTSVVEAPLELLSRPAEEAAERADAAASEAVQIANDAVEQAQSDIDEAIANAEDTANHPTYVGEDNYVYVWDKTTKSYNKTSVYVRGEGFKVSKTYVSIEEMEADTEHGLKEGDFVLINTDDVENPDNAKIYVVDAEGKFTFLVDMSGAIGFTGKTPQIEIGIITVGVGRDDAGATLTENGLDEEGNPKYLLNLHIPSIRLSDLSSEEIALLQSPANEMIAQLEETDNQVKANEEARVSAEEQRASSENVRVETEKSRVQAETSRVNAEKARVDAETARANNENARKSAETTRSANESTRIANEDARKASENTRVSSENARNTAEQGRVDAENAREESESTRKASENTRNSQEQTRQSNESVRTASENTRISNEGARQDNEAKREQSETARNTNEAARVKAEEDRAADYAELRKDIVEATGNANDAASETRNTPIIKNGTWWIYSAAEGDYVDTATPATSKSPQIQNGTWWTWDDENGVYVDTGQAVSSDYILTKEKIEGVFQGDIKSHFHSQYAERSEIPTKVSELDNDEEYVTSTELEGKGYATSQALTEGLSGKQPTIADLETIREGASLGATAIQEIPSEYVTEDELTQKGYATVAQLNEGLGSKQETITDLASIREGAVLGKTAIQEDDLVAKNYATKTELGQGLEQKQEKNLYFTNVTVSVWVEDDTYENYPYRSDIPLVDVTPSMIAEVIFGINEVTSGQYAPICETKDGILSIWSNLNKTITIPTIIINK